MTCPDPNELPTSCACGGKAAVGELVLQVTKTLARDLERYIAEEDVQESIHLKRPLVGFFTTAKARNGSSAAQTKAISRSTAFRLLKQST